MRIVLKIGTSTLAHPTGLLNIRQTVYSRYERGAQTIPLQHLLKLADFYNTSTDYILGRTNQQKPYPKK